MMRPYVMRLSHFTRRQMDFGVPMQADLAAGIEQAAAVCFPVPVPRRAGLSRGARADRDIEALRHPDKTEQKRYFCAEEDCRWMAARTGRRYRCGRRLEAVYQAPNEYGRRLMAEYRMCRGIVLPVSAAYRVQGRTSQIHALCVLRRTCA